MVNPLKHPQQSNRVVFFAVLVFEIVFLMAARTPIDSDLWWHLAAGEQTLKNGWPVLMDTFSFTRAEVPWTNHSWLSEVILAVSMRAGGWIGLSALVAILAAGSMLLVYGQMSGHPIWRAFIIVLASLVAAPVWTPRPQIFSLFLLAWLSYLVTRYWVEGKGRLFWLPLIFILWSNLHGGYTLGFIFLGCALAGGLLDRFLNPASFSKARFIQLAVWSLVCVFAVLINPNGLNMWRIPFQTVGVGALQQAIPEWASPDFHDIVQQPFLLFLAGLVAALGLAGRPVSAGRLVSVVVFTAMALLARRNFAPFALVAAPVLAAAGWLVIERVINSPGIFARFRPVENRLRKPSSINHWVDISILTVLGLACVLKVIAAAQPSTVNRYLSDTFPVEAAAWIKEYGPPGKLFNEYAWGGYLISTLPEYPVYVDGRTDLFGDEIIGEWLGVMSAKDDWQAVMDHWKVRLVLVGRGQTLEPALKDAGWDLLYQDDVAVVYGR